MAYRQSNVFHYQYCCCTKLANSISKLELKNFRHCKSETETKSVRDSQQATRHLWTAKQCHYFRSMSFHLNKTFPVLMKSNCPKNLNLVYLCVDEV